MGGEEEKKMAGMWRHKRMRLEHRDKLRNECGSELRGLTAKPSTIAIVERQNMGRKADGMRGEFSTRSDHS